MRRCIYIYLGRADIRDGSKEEEEEEERRLRAEELAEEIRQTAEDSLERLEMFRSGGVENLRFHGSLLLPRSSSKTRKMQTLVGVGLFLHAIVFINSLSPPL